MSDTLFEIHRGLGYVVILVVLAVAVVAYNRAKNGQEFTAGPFSLAMVLLDIQVTLGVVFYVVASAWDYEAMGAYVHPAVMLVALGVGHAGLASARREQMAADAYRKVGRMLVIATVLIGVGIGIASAA